MVLLAYALLLIFGMLVEPHEGSFEIPLLNIATRYDIGFVAAFVKIWDYSNLQTGKIYFFLSAMKTMALLFMSSVIYFYISHTAS